MVPSPCRVQAVVIGYDLVSTGVGALSDLTAMRRHPDFGSHAKMMKICKSERVTFVAETKLPSLGSALSRRKQ